MINSHKDLIVWQKSIELVEEIYKLTRKFPKSEIYGLSSQMQRAAVAIPSNIAEGAKRGHRAEYTQFVSIANGSAAELETQLILTRRLFPKLNTIRAIGLTEEVLKMLHVMLHSLKQKS